MTLEPLELPDHLPACHTVIERQDAILFAQQQKIAEQQQRIEELEARLEQRLRKVAAIQRQLEGLPRDRFVKKPCREAGDDPRSVGTA